MSVSHSPEKYLGLGIWVFLAHCGVMLHDDNCKDTDTNASYVTSAVSRILGPGRNRVPGTPLVVFPATGFEAR